MVPSGPGAKPLAARERGLDGGEHRLAVGVTAFVLAPLAELCRREAFQASLNLAGGQVVVPRIGNEEPTPTVRGARSALRTRRPRSAASSSVSRIRSRVRITSPSGFDDPVDELLSQAGDPVRHRAGRPGRLGGPGHRLGGRPGRLGGPSHRLGSRRGTGPRRARGPRSRGPFRAARGSRATAWSDWTKTSMQPFRTSYPCRTVPSVAEGQPVVSRSGRSGCPGSRPSGCSGMVNSSSRAFWAWRRFSAWFQIR